MLKIQNLVSHREKKPGLFKQISDQSKLVDNQQILNYLGLMEDFTIGKAIGEGDCFFDSVAQGLRQLKPDMEFTVQSLRRVCREIALDNQQLKDLVIADARGSYDPTVMPSDPSISDDELWNAYLANIECTAEDIEGMRIENPYLYELLTNLKYGSTLQAPIWGRPNIEGIIICNQYNVKLHVIENLRYSGWSSYLIDELGSRPVSTNYNAENVIHIINKGGSHFEPVLERGIQLMSEIQKKFISIMEDSDLTENGKLEKLKDFFRTCKKVDVNFQVNQHDDTPLHIAVYRGELKIVKFLLKVGAEVNALNRGGKTTINIAEDSNRKDIAKVLQPFVLYRGVDVPGDGNCLFWSAALAYLTPVKFDDDAFSERFKKLFGNDCNVKAVQMLIQQGNNADIYKDNTLIRLVTRVFRGEVVDTAYLNRDVLKDKINIEDFLESHSGDYFVKGIFKKRFESKFGVKEIKQCTIDTSKLQPSFFDESAVREIRTELGKIKKRNQIKEFIFDAYLECMRVPGIWGGRHEVNLISELLETMIIVSQKNSEDYALYNEGKKYCNKVYMFYDGMQHYQFYQVEHSTLIQFVLNFIQSFEMKLIIYCVLANTLRNGNKMFLDGMDTSKFVQSILGFSAYTGTRIMSDERTSLKVGNVIKATKSFISLSDLIETFNEHKLGFRKILADAGCNIFQSFEMQFEEIGFNHILKVVDDIVNKIIECYIQKEYRRDLINIGIAEALVSDRYTQGVSDKAVQYGKKGYNLRDLYENIGIAEGREGSFIYYRRNNEDNQYGYRRSFVGEKSKRMYDARYTKVETTNVEHENYVYASDQQDFKDIVEQVFYVINKEIQVPNKERINDFIVKIKSHVEQEISFLSKHILSCYRERKQSLDMNVKYLAKEKGEIGRFYKEEYIERGKDVLRRTEKNRDVISLMEENLEKLLDPHYYLKVKEEFVKRAEVINQDYSNFFESQYNDTIEFGSLWSRIKASSVKALASLFGKMNCKDVYPPVEEFTGRQEQIEEICEKLQGGAVAIIGPSGIGKTQLARKFINENKEVYLHAYEVNTQDMLSIESSFASFVRDKLAMSIEEEKNKKRKKCLLLFEGVKKEDVEKVLKIKGERGGFDCLFTSSDHGYQDIAEVTLGNLEEVQAKQLVKKILGIADELPNRQVTILVGKLKNFPLAIKLAVACIKNRNLGEALGICEYLAQYEDFDHVSPRYAGQNEYDRILQITLLISIKAIQEINSRKEVLKILNAIAYFGPGQIDPGLFLSYNMYENELYSFFELLEQYSIVHAEERDDYKLYVMHELVRKAIRSQLSIDKEKQVLSYTIKLVLEAEEDFYARDVGHLLSLFSYSQGYENLTKERCYLACTIISTLNMLCKYKEAFTFGSKALQILIATNEYTVMARYEMARTMIALGEYDLALKILWDLKRQYILNDVFPLLSFDKEIIFIYFKQKRYEDVFSYVRSDYFLLTKLLDEKDRCYLDNYLSIVNTVAKVFMMQKRYTDAFTILHCGRELKDEIFLKKSDFDSYSDPYFYPSNIHEFYNLEARYTYALLSFFIMRDRKKITMDGEMLPHKENLSRRLSIRALFNQLQDILKNQEGSQYLQPAPYSIEENMSEASQEIIRKKTLQRFEAVLQLQEKSGFLESHPKVLSVKFYIALLHSYLGDREKALQELQQVQELQEKGIGVNHPDTLDTVDAIQKLFTRGEDRLAYLKNEIERRESLLQLERSDLNVRGVSLLKEIYMKKSSNDYPSVDTSSSSELLPEDKRKFLDIEDTQTKRRKIDNQQQVSSLLGNVNIDLSYQQDDIVHLLH